MLKLPTHSGFYDLFLQQNYVLNTLLHATEYIQIQSLLSEVIEPKGRSHMEREKGRGGLIFPPIMYISCGEGERGGGGLLFPPIMYISRGEGEKGGGSSISTNHVYLTWRGRKVGGLLFPPIMYISHGEGERGGGLLFPPIMYISRGEGERGSSISTNHVYLTWRGRKKKGVFYFHQSCISHVEREKGG